MATTSRQAMPLAVTGVSLRVGPVVGLEAFSQALAAGASLVRPLPASRFDARWLDGSGALAVGAALGEPFGFPFVRYGLTAAEAAALDPQQRLMLTAVWEALEDAALLGSTAASETGIWTAVALTDWQQRTLRDRSRDPTAWDATGSLGSLVPGRVAYLLDTRGPAVALDTACSSGLVALHAGASALRRGEVDTAVVGAVNVLLSPDAHRAFAAMGALSPTGRCHSFGAAADGYVRSEAAVALVLRRLDDARDRGEPVHAVLHGIAINQDGRSNGLTAPNPAAQRAVVRAAMEDAGLGVDDVDVVEAHGTGTPLGDPIELAGLRGAFAGRSRPLYLTASKAVFGHTEAAAGLVGVAAAMATLRSGVVPGVSPARSPNPRLRLGQDALRVAPDAVSLPDVALVGVSSFGFSGTNAHAIIGKAPAFSARAVERGPRGGASIVTVSADDEASAEHAARQVADALEAGAALDAVARTLAEGRRPLPARVAVAATTADEAARRLRAATPVHAANARGPQLRFPDVVEDGSWAEVAARLGLSVHALPAPVLAGVVLAAVAPRVGWWAQGAACWGAAVAAGMAQPADAAARSAEALRFPRRARLSGPLGPVLDPATWRAALDAETPGPASPPQLPGSAFDALAALVAAGVDVPPPLLAPPGAPLLHLPATPSSPAAAAAALTPPTEPSRPDPWAWRTVEVAAEAGAPARGEVVGAGTLADALAAAIAPGAARVLVAPSWETLRAEASAEVGPVLHVVVDDRDEEGAAVAALARVVARERAARWGGLVLVRDGASPDAVAAALASGPGDVVVRGEEVHALQLERWPAPPPSTAVDPAGAWWVAGATGHVGRAVVEALFGFGVRRFLLTSRSGVSEGDAEALRARGAEVAVAVADLSDAHAVLAARDAWRVPLTGVVHAAGHAHDAPLAALTASAYRQLRAVLADGLDALAAATAHDPLEALLLVGSASTTLGIPGQGAYAAAHAAAQVRAARLRARGVPASAPQLGPWDGGLATEAVRRVLAPLGLRPLPAVSAARALLHARDRDEALLIDLDATAHAAASPVRVVALLAAGAGGPTPAAAPARALPSDVGAVVRDTVARLLGRAGDEIALDAGLFDLGLDSLGAVALARALADALGRDVPTTAVFDHGTVRGLTAALHADASPATSAASVAPAPPVGDDAIAVVGLACRLPGADDPAAFAALLRDGRVAMRPIPRARWDVDALFDPRPGTPGRSYVREAGLLDEAHVTDVDAAGLGLGAEEARHLDPAQRLLLTVAAEALADAGLHGGDVGVFVGVGPSDYARRLDPLASDASVYAGTGNQPSFAAGRISHAFGLRGPALVLDTACSSSLVAVHLAAEALREGRCRAALAGGAHLLLAPDTTVQLCQLKALSPTQRCHTFDAAADGYARGEGAGVVVLKRLSDALADGDVVHAVLEATGVNHDGGGAGLTAPNGAAQRALLADTLRRAGVCAADVGFVEAHGTGTRLGDPVEVGALRDVYGAREGGAPLALHATKAQIGHLELAAGVAGFLAAVLAVRDGFLPGQPGLRTLNPALGLGDALRVPTASEAWDAPVRRAAVSAFGLSGTNAHAILRAPPSAAHAVAAEESVLCLHGAAPERVVAWARQLAARWPEGATVGDVAGRLAARMPGAPPWRASVLAGSVEAARAALLALTEGAAVRARVGPEVVFLVPGQGAQGLAMAAGLAQDPAIAAVFDACDVVLREARGEGLWPLLTTPDARVHDTAWTQPALYALGVGLGRWWMARGVQPAAVLGHSVGELAAATLAGLWSVEDGCRVAEARGRLLAALPADGAMLSVRAPEAVVAARLTGQLVIAARNAADRVTVSGPAAEVEGLEAALAADGVASRRLQVRHAFHSPAMAPAAEALEAVVASVGRHAPTIDVLGNLTGRPEREALREPSWWSRQLLAPVRFGEAVASMPPDAVVIELGPAALGGLVARARPDVGVVAGLSDGVARLEAWAARAWAHGVGHPSWWAAPHRPGPLPPPAWLPARAWIPATSATAPLPHSAAGAPRAWTLTWVAAPAGRGGGDVFDARGLALSGDSLVAVRDALLAGKRVWVPREGVWTEAVAGLARAARAEGFAGSVVRGEPPLPADLPDAVELSVDGGRALTPVLTPVAGRGADAAGGAVTGTWWVTGGLGTVGRAVARALVSAGAARVVLSSRRPVTPSDGTNSSDGPDDLGPALSSRPVDVTDADALAAMARDLVEEGLQGVVHAAGLAEDAPLRGLSADDFGRALATKVDAAETLAAALPASVRLVLVGSAAGALGWVGQGAYGAANAALVGVASARRARGGRAVTVAFGPWAGGIAQPEQRAAMASVGMDALEPEDAARALVAHVEAVEDVLIAALRPDVLAAVRPWQAGLLGAAPTPTALSGVSPSDAGRLAREAVAEVLGAVDPAGLDAQTGLFELGLDSLGAVALAAALSRRLGRPVPDTVAFDAPSIAALTRWIGRDQGPAARGQPAGGARAGGAVAITGLALRVPGGAAPDATDVDAAWARWLSGDDLVGEVPRDRWDPDALGEGAPRHGAFLRDVTRFAPEAFGLSPREARLIDPQQRLLLTLAAEALEVAALPAEAVRDTAGAVFVGLGGRDWERVLARADLPADDRGYVGLGNDPAFAAGRVAHRFGLLGPALTLDTACSSGLVAVHLAVRALRAGEASFALAGGVRLLLDPEDGLRLAALRALSPTGRCRPFDAAADGYVRSEGAALFVLEPLEAALERGAPVLAVIEGSAVGHDGAAAGLTVPSGAAQRAVLRAALADAGVEPADVGVVEAHGTGTPLGDPVEAGALAEVFGPREATLLVTAGKATQGHAELAAGALGLARLVLAARTGVVPPQPAVASLNPRLAEVFTAGPLRVPSAPRPWPTGARGGVSAFGLSGTNAHVVVAPPPVSVPSRGASVATLRLAGPSADAVAETAVALAAWWAQHPDVPARDLARTLDLGRSRGPWQAAVVVEGAADAPSLAGVAPVRAQSPAVGLLFTGQGSQWAGMLREAWERHPAVRARVDAADALLRSLRGEGLRDVLLGVPGAASLRDTVWTQPALYVVETALAELWLAWGLEPAVLVGHSVGELAAAAVAGAVDWEDGLRVVEARGRLMGALPAGGAMAALRATEAVVAALLGELGRDDVEIATINAVDEVVVAGGSDAVAAAVAAAEARGVDARPLAVSHAFHSARMAPMLEAFRAVAASVAWRAPRLPVASNLTGGLLGEGLADGAAWADYWVRHVREPVRFAEGLASARARGVDAFVEVGPHPVLCALGARAGGGTWIPSLRRGMPADRSLAEARAAWLNAGGALTRGACADGGRLVALPPPRLGGEPLGVTVAAPSAPPRAASVAVPAAPLRAGADRQGVRRAVSEVVARVLGLADASQLAPRTGLFDQGLDSLMATQLAESLGRLVGVEAPPTLVFDAPTVEALADWALAARDAGPPSIPIAVDPPAAPAARGEPPAITGLACRLPGVPDVAAFWDLLCAGGTNVGVAPRERFPDLDALLDPAGGPGRALTDAGAFFDDVAGFDPVAFGISPREAAAMDPQQRLVLELCWEALQDAGLDPGGLDGAALGVFVGMGASEYDARFVDAPPSDQPDAYSGTGNDTSFAAGRVAYLLGATGPAVTVNTACSAGLVALDMARAAIADGRCERALVVAVNLILRADGTVRLSQLRALSPTGACHAFDGAADGYVRAEGGAAVLLEAEAARAGRRVHARLLSTAVNHDGRASALTVPSGAAQEAVVRGAWAAAGVSPARVAYVEAHGTGTPLGDPVEARALAAVAAGRAAPLPVGAVKANVGHTELAAGLVGLLKAVLVVRERLIPPLRGLATLNPRIPPGPLRFPTEGEALDGDVVGVSSFGLSGTNAHAVLGAAERSPVARSVAGPVLVTLGARHAAAREALSGSVADRLEAGADLAGVALAAARGRSSGFVRVAAVGADASSVAAALRRGGLRGDAPAQPPRLAVVVPGAGKDEAAVWALAQAIPAVATGLAAALDALRPHVDVALLPVAEAPGEAASVDAFVAWHATAFAARVALAWAWREAGVVPELVAGHGDGQLLAGWLAGAWTLEDAAAATVARARTLARGGAEGGLRVPLPEAQLAPRLPPGVVVVAVNEPGATVVAGPLGPLGALRDALNADGVAALPVTPPRAHGPWLDPTAVCAGWPQPQAVAVPLVSGQDGAVVTGAAADLGWWAAEAAAPVRFVDVAARLQAEGVALVLELAPAPTLLGTLRRALPGVAVLPGTAPRAPAEAFLTSMAEAWVAGVAVDAAALCPPAPWVDLPPVPFIRRRLWVDAPRAAAPEPDAEPAGVASAALTAEPSAPASTPRWVWPVLAALAAAAVAGWWA